MPTDSREEQLPHRALELARAGVGLASPNPYVGAVIADSQGNVVGEGTYTYAGIKHAEVLALEKAGERARGGTLYINLEPHAHHGRTPPCTDALIAAGIRRVVASMADPNPKVRERGFEQLRAAGVQVEVGGLQDEAKKLNEAFGRYVRSGVPFVTLKSAMTLDARIAPPVNHKLQPGRNFGTEPGFRGPSFRGVWITGEPARAHVHELRHQHDAILAGIGTVLGDDPLLTDRSGKSRRRPLLRVILDSQLRLPLDSNIVQDATGERRNDLLVFCGPVDNQQCQAKRTQLERAGVRVESVSVGIGGRLDLESVLRYLARLEVTSVMIEGGSTVNGAALTSGIVDKLFLYYAPKIFGEDAVPFARVAEFSPISLRNVQLHRLGEDFAVEGYIRDPYE
jgi:diaminohydroxyphosphoribosylaminopyrimidine deaminase / 5-amino-6-(5-phosphoribosylamino)uracil reductase